MVSTLRILRLDWIGIYTPIDPNNRLNYLWYAVRTTNLALLS